MVTRAIVDGLPNDPIPASVAAEALEGLLALVDVDARDVQSVTASATKIRAKVAVRTKRGRLLPGMWAHVEVGIIPDDFYGAP